MSTSIKEYGGKIPEKILRYGDKGDEVKKLQRFLNFALEAAFRTCKYDKLKVDGIYGGKVAGAVRLWKDINHFRRIDGVFGTRCKKVAKGYKMHPRVKAITWAVAISRDNDFSYGTGARAHHNGCYFCGTNLTSPKFAPKGSRWEKTYCCNPFIHAAYAHGAQDEDMLKACKAKQAADMHPQSWMKFGFVKVGKAKDVPFNNLKRGDVIIATTPNHVWMYTGRDQFVEATSQGGFGADSIHHAKGCRKKYNRYRKENSAYVMRYRI